MIVVPLTAASMSKNGWKNAEEFLRDVSFAKEDNEEIKMKQTEQKKKDNKTACWGDHETLILIDKYIKLKNKINPKIIWTEIARNFKSKNLDYTHTQIKRRFHFLLNKYKETKDHNNTTGNSPATCPFYELFDEMFTKEHNITPLYASLSIKPLQNNTIKNQKKQECKIEKESKVKIIDKKEVQIRIAEKRKAMDEAGCSSKEKKIKKKNSEKEEFMEFKKKRDERYMNLLKDQENRMADEIRNIGNILKSINK